MKLVDQRETVVLVTGITSPAEEKDRPLAYRLKAEIDRRGEGTVYRRAVVVADDWYVDHRTLQSNPTIAIGGPGSNAVAQQYVGLLATVWTQDDRAFVQADLDAEPERVVLWGIDSASTGDAVEAFMAQGLLDAFLERIWRFRSGVVV